MIPSSNTQQMCRSVLEDIAALEIEGRLCFCAAGIEAAGRATENGNIVERIKSVRANVKKAMEEAHDSEAITSLFHRYKGMEKNFIAAGIIKSQDSDIMEVVESKMLIFRQACALDYFTIESSKKTLDEKVSAILKLPFNDEASRRLAIAYFVNTQKVPLKILLDKGMTKSELLGLMPRLKVVDLRNIYNGNEPDFEIKLIRNCPKVSVLFIQNSEIKELPELPLCQILNCDHCDELMQLPGLPLCQELSCECCVALTQLPELPLCKELCCRGCSALTKLPELPLCEKLNCNACTALTQLPELPLCKELSCYGCTALTNLPELPLCELVNCSECLALVRMPQGLPRCRILNCTECSAMVLPEVPTEAEVYHTFEYEQLEVDVSQLALDPKSYLLYLGNNYLLKNIPFPGVVYVSKEGEKSPAIDVGGVRRDFITRLFELLFMEREKEINGQKQSYAALPIHRDHGVFLSFESTSESEETSDVTGCYQIIGRLFALSARENSYFKTGEIFDPRFFQLLHILGVTESVGEQKGNADSLLEDRMIKSYLILNGYSEEIALLASEVEPTASLIEQTHAQTDMLWELINHERREQIAQVKELDFMNAANRLQLREAILAEAKLEGRIKAALIIADEMKHAMGSEWETLLSLEMSAPGVLQQRIQGRLSAQLLKEQIMWEDVDEKTKEFVTHWIDHASKDQLEYFMRFTTSNKTLSNSKIVVQAYSRGKDYIPIAHTCYNTLELSNEYPDQKTFDGKLNLALREGLVGEGFQFA